MISNSREFPLIHINSAGATARGVFEVGGGFFKFTQDLLLPAGTNTTTTFPLWDYQSPILDWNVSSPPPHASYYLDTLTLLIASRAPTPGAPLSGVTYDVTLYNGVSGDSPLVLHNTGATTFSVDYLVVLGSAFSGAVPMLPTVLSAPSSPTDVGIGVAVGGTLSQGSYMRVVINGRFL